MELKKFFEQFSPKGDEEFLLVESGSKSRGFNVKDFPKALANYTALICEKQREMCRASFIDAVGWDDFMADFIVQAPQPKIDEL